MEIITSGQIYWLTRCDAIRQALACDGGFIGFAILGIAVICFFSLITCWIKSDVRKWEKKGEAYAEDAAIARCQLQIVSGVRRIGFVLLFTFLPLWLGFRILHPLVPTTKEMAAILVIPRIANAESVQGIGRGIVDLAQDWMAELRPQNVKSTAKAVKAGLDSTADKVKEVVKEVSR